MKIGVLLQAFGTVAKDVLFGEDRHWYRKQLGAVISGDLDGYLVSKSLHFASEHRKMGHDITDERVHEILNSRDSFYCENLTPLNFSKDSFDNAQAALVAVRETIREDLGIALPRMTIRELQELGQRP